MILNLFEVRQLMDIPKRSGILLSHMKMKPVTRIIIIEWLDSDCKNLAEEKRFDSLEENLFVTIYGPYPALTTANILLVFIIKTREDWSPMTLRRAFNLRLGTEKTRLMYLAMSTLDTSIEGNV